MSKKLILFLMVLLFGSTSFLRADEVTIGDPTATETSSYLPGYSLYKYALSQQIYTADEIGMGGTISDVTLWLKNSSSYARNYNIYMKEVSENTFADDNSWVAMTAADLVATGVLANGISSPVATTFTLSTPFNYTGMGNLVICFQDVTGSWSSGAASVIMVTTDNQAIYAYRDPEAYDPSAPGASGTTIAKKSVVRLTIEGVVPPTAGVSIIPDEFILGDKALNSNVWKEPFAAKIYNGGEPTVISASLSNTSGENAFIMSEEILDMPLATGEATDFTLTIQNGVPSGEYVEEFTLFYTENRSIMTVPVVANIYNASYPDVVEYARTMSWTSGAYTDTPDADNMHADYNLWGMDEKLPDVVYQFTLSKDSHFHAEAGNDFIAIYKKVSDLHLTAEVEPLILGENGVIEDEIMFAGTYYLVAASDAITTVSANYTEIPAPGEIAFIAPTPADGATSINAPVTIKWAPTDITATEYQVVFGTSPIVNADPTAWIPMDDNFGTYVVTELLPTTQYFYKVFARNSNGVVSTERRGFTSTLIAPHAVTASETEIFVDQTTLIKWKLAGQGGFTGEVTVADGTATSSYVPVWGLWVDDFTRSEMIYPAEMLEEMEGGEITSLTFYLSTPATTAWAPAQFNVYMREVTGTTLSSYFGSADATIVYSGTLDGTGTTMTINLDTPYTYDGGNLLIGIEEPVEGTFKSASFYGVAASGASASGYNSSSLSSVSFNQRDFLPKVTFTCGGRGNRDLIGYNVYYGQKNTENEYVYTKANNSMLTEREFLLGNLPYDVTTDGLDINVTAVYDQGESVHSTPIVKVWVSGYGKLTGTVTELISGAPVAGVNVKFMGKDEFNNNVTFEGTTNTNGVYTINNVKAGQYIGEATLDGMEPNYSDQVTLAYNGTETVNFVIHEEYKQVLSVYAEEVDPTMSRVKWSLTENIGPGPQPGGPTTFTEGFEGSLNGWNGLTLLADGGSWIHSSQNLGGYDYSTVAHSGTGFAMCYSFVDYVGACSTDSYMYTPQKYSIVNGSTLRFFADNANDTYPENFSVCVSTADNPSSSADFTQVWSGGAKGTGSNGAMVRHADNRYENWREHVIDLSSFAGQNVWIAFHDVNTDCYEIWIDDVELTTSRGTRDVQEYAVYRKAILKEAALTPADSVYFGTTTDTNYADFGWANMEPGLYQYGVSAHYPIPTKGDRSMTTVVYDFEDGVIPSEFNTTGSYPWTIATENGGYVIKSSNGGVGGSTSSITMTYDFPSAGTIAFDFISLGEGADSNDWDNSRFYVDGEMMFRYGAHTAWEFYTTEVTEGTHTFKWEYKKDGSVNPTGDYFAVDNIALTFETPGGDTNDNPITPITWSNVLPKDMEAVVTVNAHITVGSVAGAVVTLVNDFENMTPYVAELDETGTVTFEDFRKGEYTVTVDLMGYMSDVMDMPMSIWADTTVIEAHFTEIFKPVEAFAVSGTGFASWTDMLPEPDRFAEKYHVMLNGVFQGETTDNFMQLDITDLTVGETYTAAVAVVYTTGMSPWVEAEFTVIDCATVQQQVEDLEGVPACMDVILTWNGATPGPGPGPTPPPTGDVIVVLQTDDVWGDDSGYQMLLDDTHSLYGTTIPTSGVLSLNCSGNEAIYAQFSHKIPTNADGNCSTQNMVNNNSVSITIPAGTYDWCITNPTPGEKIYIASSNGNIGGRYDDFVFEGGKTYTFHVYYGGQYDATDLTVTPSKKTYTKMVSDDTYSKSINYVVVRDNNETAETCGYTTVAAPVDAAWDFLADFTCTSGYQYGVVTDGQNIYTSSWSSSSSSMFYKYDMEGNFIEEFNISGCGQLRDMTYDGQYFYGVANSSIIYCVDLANHTLVGQTTTSYGAMRCCSYDPQRDGFWVVGNWSGNLSLVDRTGAVAFTGPEPESAAGIAYYKDADNVEHVLCFNNVDDGVYDYNVTTNTMGGQVFNYNNAPGATGGSAGGCHIATYAGKLAFFGDLQQEQNYVAIYELAGNPGPGPGPASTITPNKFNIFMDGEFVGATADNTFTVTCTDTEEHVYEVYFVDSNYNFSCGATVTVAAGVGLPVTDLEAVEGYDPEYGSGAQITWNGNANQYKIYANGNLLGATTDTEVFIYGLQVGTYTFGVVAVYDECESEMVTVEFIYDAVPENAIISAIYPNPTSSDLHINATAMKHISVYNAMGQMVYDQDVTGDEMIINMSQYEAGVYMVNVITENGSSVKRITVVK